jgi:uncharacterized protein YodC (DUF2158 family)
MSVSDVVSYYDLDDALLVSHYWEDKRGSVFCDWWKAVHEWDFNTRKTGPCFNEL